MKAIGGYFELETSNNGNLYHNNLIAVNSGRSAFELILKQTNPRQVLLPYYTCDVILQPLNRCRIPYRFYELSNSLLPKVDSLNEGEVILYVNYFGISDKKVAKVVSTFPEVIIDNSQSFYSQYHEKIPTFYSPRKFFGIPDGGFAYIPKKQEPIALEKGYSYNRCSHLLNRIDLGAEGAYNDFIENDKKLSHEGPTEMSKLTQKLMNSISFEEIAKKRKRNFSFLHKTLSTQNLFSKHIDESTVPMVYPFISEKPGLRNHLISKKIFVPQYWPNVKQWHINNKSLEYFLTDNLLALPIDQRYGLEEMEKIIYEIKNHNGQ